MASRHHYSRWERSPQGANAQGYHYQNQGPVSPVSPVFAQGNQGYYQNAQQPYYPNGQSVGVEPPPYAPPAYPGHSHSVSSRNNRDPREYQLALRSNPTNQVAQPAAANYQVSRYSSTEDELNSEDAAILEETTAWIPQAPSNPKVGRAELEKPVVIPRIDSVGKMSFPLPFLRAYSPVLQAFDISEKDFLTFIDNLAVAQTPPASIQAIEVVGAAIGFVPLPPAMFLGMAMETGAVAGYIIAYKRRTKAFFKKVNKEFFAPRGLQASIVKNKDMPAKIGYDKSLPDLMPVRPGTGYVPRRDRRMQILAPYVAPITEDVPEPIKQRGLIDKWARYQVDRKFKSKEKKHRKKAAKMRSKEASLKPESEIRKEQSQASSRRNSWSSGSSIYSTDSEDDDAASAKSEHWRIQQINREADRDLKKIVGSKPKEVKAIEEWRKKELKKADKEIIKEDKKAGKNEKKHGKKKEKKFKSDLKRAERFEFIVIEKLRDTRR